MTPGGLIAWGVLSRRVKALDTQSMKLVLGGDWVARRKMQQLGVRVIESTGDNREALSLALQKWATLLVDVAEKRVTEELRTELRTKHNL